MAGRLNSGKIWLVLAAGCAVAASALAQSFLPDPTRPPAGFVQDGELSAPTFSGPVLESVIIPKKGKPLAVISGQPVHLGESYGESRLIRLNEREAVLEGPAGIERLKLTPGIEKTNIVTKHKSQTSSKTRSGSKP
jgi:MSHA biogenesis protein MshK